MEEDIKIFWEHLSCEACWNEDISICKNCECKCIQFKAFENILNELKRLQKDNYKLDRENQLLFEENELLKAQNITYEVDNKEVLDALHMLLHCSLKDTEYITQVGQFNIVSKYIKQLEKKIKN